ncbi:shikimate dehydrogenase [Labrenzia sp. 011]|uniref:shikimate dehydrogenase n=1 Tax=Labrenzia sp. 011 TaxID=2171494 RepID=UPI000D5135A1|nr:shikimate dehydrogenase [Labrenzia sp. 011]PVB62006.1 shikimate dehydrogenase [Labrenzia sp. 011]
MTAVTRKAAVTGHPVAHSRSPLIHGYWLKKHGIAGEYGCLDVAPEEADRFFRNFSQSGLVGANITVPHKETAAAACDRLDEAARVMGAANTIWLDDDGALHGSNTDWTGFLGNLDQRAPGWDDTSRTAVVLGAGGAARAIVFALLSRKFTTVHIVNRTAEKARKIAAEFGTGTIGHGWDNLGILLEEADFLVNSTSLGMTGNPPLGIDLSPLRKDALVTDIVYVPLQTDLLKQAEQRGNPVIDGLGMLLHQAVPGFERWFGVRPQVDEALRALIVEDLGGRS